MKRNHLLLLVGIVLFFAACSSSKESPSAVWVNKEKIQGKSFKSIFIIALTANVQARVQVEKDLEALAAARGYRAVKSIDVMKVSLDDPKPPTKEEIVAKIKASGCEAVFVTALLNKDEAVHYTPGTQAYTVTPNYTFYGNYYGYYSNYYTTVSTPGYYTQEKDYFMLTNFYDAASEELMWSAQSKVFSPSTLPAFSKMYIETLLKQLEKEKILKK